MRSPYVPVKVAAPIEEAGRPVSLVAVIEWRGLADRLLAGGRDVELVAERR